MIKIKENNKQEFYKIISINLHKYNRSQCKWINDNTQIKPSAKKYYNFEVLDNDNIVGGAVGVIQFGWYFLENLWIDEKYRGKNIGTLLIKKIEDCAKKNNAIGVRTETWNFQAKGFYEKMGYTLYASFEDCPPGTIEYFFKKKL